MTDLPARKLSGRRILITGAGSGIGAATANLFTRHGAKLMLTDRNSDAVKAIADCNAVLHSTIDVADESSVNAAVNAAVDALGGLDGLVNCAGIYIKTPLLESKLEDWNRTLAINLTGTFLVCRAAAPHLLASKNATIVNLSSGIGLMPFSERTAYAASKGGVIAMSKVLSMELAPNVRVNVVAPGSIDTPMVQSAYGTTTSVAANANRYALQRIGRADEVAEAILFLTSGNSSLVTGITMAVDGGRTFH